MKVERILFENMSVYELYETKALLIGIREKHAKNGKPYLELDFVDGYTRIRARWFNVSERDLELAGIEIGFPVDVILDVGLYHDQKNYKVETMSPDYSLSREEAINEFVIKAPIDPKHEFANLLIELCIAKDSAYSLPISPISHLAMRMLVENEKAFIHSAGGKSIHHDSIGGLLQHTKSMLDCVHSICDNYPTLDKELLLAGVALHDIGKTREMETDEFGATRYTSEGRLFGHSSIGIAMIDEEIIKGKFAYDPERVMLLKHMIASHHGSKQCGAIAEPAIPEAVVLHALDMIDSKGNIFDKAYKGIGEGELSSRIYGLNGTSAYKAREEVYLPSIA